MDVDMPICRKVYEVIYSEKNPQEAVNELLERDLKHEMEFE
jgi:glycerol-3-phosphate dehydrogenase